ncbi:MAG: alpha/beta hydrolase, partial [Candidatus Nanohaloarchaea archaeon]
MTEKQFIEVENGEEVATVLHRSDSDRWIFFCHGFGSDKEGSYESRCEKAVEEGWNAVRFDFRGNGESGGRFIEQTLSSKIQDLEAVVEHFEPSRYVLFGSSFGGKVVFHSDLDSEALVLKAPVTYSRIMDKFREVVEEKGEFQHHPGATIDGRFFEDFDRYSFGDVEIEVPVAIFHGGED